MASLQKIITTRYIDKAGNRVARGTPGAEKKTEESKKWYACWREGKRQVRIPLARDKAVSQVMLGDLIRKRERGDAEMVNPYKVHLDRAVTEHIDEYLADVGSRTRSTDYHKELRRILTAFVTKSRAKILRDVTVDRVATYLAKMKVGPTTRNAHRCAIVIFMNWLEGKERIERNPITKRNVELAKKGQKRQRRALTAEEIQRLLIAVREYPVRMASVNTGGKNAKNRPATHVAKLKPETRKKLERRGRERWLIYRIAILTCLRRIEISRLKGLPP